jgi:GT2 family glycosyltransferase
VGAPWVHIGDGDLAEAIAEARSNAVDAFGLNTPSTTFPTEPIETPFLYSQVLIRRSVLDALNYDTAYKGNAYREETALFIAAAAAGFKCLLTPATCTYQVGNWDGGQRSGPFSREWHIFTNNYRFLKKHGDWLREHGHISGPRRAQVAFVRARWSKLAEERRYVRRARPERRGGGEAHAKAEAA